MVLNRLFYALLMIGQVRGAGRSKRDDGQEKAPGIERDAQHLSPKHANEDLGGGRVNAGFSLKVWIVTREASL